MGKIKNNVAVYFWLSKRTGIRVSWFFPSRKSADSWKRAQCHAYVATSVLEDHLNLHSKSRWIKETEIWERHKDKWNDLILRRASIVYK